MYLWRGLLALSVIATTSLFATYTSSKIGPTGPTSATPPAAMTPPSVNTKLSPNPKKVTRPKPGDIRKKYLAKPPAKVGLVRDQTAAETLAGLSPEICVEAQIFAPCDERFVLSPACLQEILLHELRLCRIKSGQEAPTNSKEPRPQLRLEVFIQPICNYYAVFMDIRLIEAACPNRIALQPKEFFQGITWERREVFCSQQYDITALVKQKTAELAQQFSTKYLRDQPAKPLPPQAVTRKPFKTRRSG